jgi:hypothetical protein
MAPQAPQMVVLAAPPASPWGYGQQPTMADQGWYAWLDSVECGPMDYMQVFNWAKSGRISANDYVKQGKYSQWTLAKSIPGLVPAAPPPPPPPPAPVAAPAPAPAPVAAAPAPAPAPAPAAKLAVTLPPPPPKAAPAAASAPPAPAAETPAAAPPPPRPAPAPRPQLPPDAPPERKWTDEWSTSTIKSTYGMGTGGAAPGPAVKAPVPVAKPKKKSSGGGGSMDVGALMKDKRVLGGLGAVLVVALAFVGMKFMPEGTGKLKTAYNDLTKLHKEIEGKASDSADAKKWEALAKSMKTKLTNATKPIGTSKHAAKASLNAAKTALDGALKAKKQEDVDKKLEDAQKKLDDAKKKLKL